MTANNKAIPAISFTTAQTGASAKLDELGMHPMQAQAFEKRGAPLPDPMCPMKYL